MSVNADHSLIISQAGDLYTCGTNENNKLGNPTIPELGKITELTRVQFPVRVIAAAAGPRHTVVIDEFGRLWGWGRNDYGQLGLGREPRALIPTLIPFDSTIRFQAVVAGEEYTLALDENGEVWGFGANENGQLGIGSEDRSDEIVKIPGLVNVISICAGYRHSIALDSFGNVWSWGYNADGQLGLGHQTTRSTPTKIPNLYDIIQISSGCFHNLALDVHGFVWSFGYNGKGQLGFAMPELTTSPSSCTATKMESLKDIASVSCGGNCSFAFSHTGKAYVFGWNAYGQMAMEELRDFFEPVENPSLKNMKIIYQGWHHGFCADPAGRLHAFGRNTEAQLGIPDERESVSVPHLIENILVRTTFGGLRVKSARR